YTPDSDFHGNDRFAYRANDGIHDGEPVTVTITVAPVNDAPVAVDDSVTGTEDTAATGNVLANDLDVENQSLTANLVSGPAVGTLTLALDGSFTYIPAPDATDTVSFTYTATDASGAVSNVA